MIQTANKTSRLALVFLISCLCDFGVSQEADPPDATVEDRLAGIMDRFPASDINGDGELSREEAASFFRKRRETMGEPQKRGRNETPEPSYADVSYGEHEKQVFDLWLVPDVTEPTPLVIFIHGGGFRSGDKKIASAAFIEKCLNAGVAFAAVNYRLSDVGPYPMMMEDCARGLQTIRHRAAEWNLNPEKIVSYGGSAGAGISLWLGFHEDLADSESEDPIARQSTRLVAVGTMNGQSTYDINDFRKWFDSPGLQTGPALPAFYQIESEADWESDRVKNLMKEASSINHLTEDDVPVYMMYSRPNTLVTEETESSVWVHHVKLGLKLKEKMEALGIECIVTAPDVAPESNPYGSVEDFLLEKVKG